MRVRTRRARDRIARMPATGHVGRRDVRYQRFLDCGKPRRRMFPVQTALP